MKKLLLILGVLVLSGCADNVSLYEATQMESVGFLHGFWHGITAGFSIIGSFFNDDIAIYAIYNKGWWYDFGFVWGIGGLTKVIRVLGALL